MKICNHHQVMIKKRIIKINCNEWHQHIHTKIILIFDIFFNEKHEMCISTVIIKNNTNLPSIFSVQSQPMSLMILLSVIINIYNPLDFNFLFMYIWYTWNKDIIVYLMMNEYDYLISDPKYLHLMIPWYVCIYNHLAIP